MNINRFFERRSTNMQEEEEEEEEEEDDLEAGDDGDLQLTSVSMMTGNNIASAVDANAPINEMNGPLSFKYWVSKKRFFCPIKCFFFTFL